MDVDPFADSQDPDQEPDESSSSRRRPNKEASRQDDDDDDEEDDDDPPKTIPPELLTRLLHEFFERDGTRVSRAANDAVARYMDIFVREAIARAAVEKEGGFLEVEDLEKIAPQLLLDL
jgi:centromere protein X